MNRRAIALALVSALSFPRAALALGVVSVGQTEAPVIDEEFFFVVYDETNAQEHLVLATRLSPARPRITLGLPVPSSPSFEVLNGLEPGRVLFALIDAEERRLRARPPVEPAPWPTRGVTAKTSTSLTMASDILFDADWLHSYASAGFPTLAEMLIETPDDGRQETTTPGVHLSFKTDRVVLPRREPKRSASNNDKPGDEGGFKSPLEVQGVRVEPKDAGPGEEVVLRVLRARSGPLLDCYEALLERTPAEAPKLQLEAVIRPKGETAQLKVVGGPTDLAEGKTFIACVTAELRKKQFPRTDEGWKLSAVLSFRPPHARPRRSHLVMLSRDRRVWKDAPSASRKEHDCLVSAADLTRAFGDPLRRALGLEDGQPAWLTHYLDRDERRAMAEDAVFEREDAPPKKVEPARAEPTPAAITKAPRQHETTSSRRRLRPLVVLVLAALAVGVGLILGKDDGKDDGPRARR